MFRNDNTLPTNAEKRDTKMMSALSLAFIGDAVWELLVREYVLSKGDAKVQALHKASIEMANADFQATAGDIIQPLLTEDELAVYRRGRNAHSAHTPKNKSVYQYSKATAFEALIGRLYLDGKQDRIFEFFDIITNTPETDKAE